MKKEALSSFAVDNSAILFLALLCKTHSNVFRFSVTLKETVDPDVLQRAVDRTYRRFPTIFASVRPGFFQYSLVSLSEPPKVQPDPGCLITMGLKEIRRCAYRVYYQENVISIEAYHVLTDGHGAIASLTTLVSEYLRLFYEVDIPTSHTLYDITEYPKEQETEDSYLLHQSGKPLRLPSCYAYQLPGMANEEWRIYNSCIRYSTQVLLDAAHRYGVSLNTLLTAVMAESVMEIQCRHQPEGSFRPVRIMVPVDLRGMFSSKTLRNFVLYALPTIEPEDRNLPFVHRVALIHQQLKKQINKDTFASIMAYNVRIQNAWYFRIIPAFLKFAIMRFAYRFFGESNSSVTFTNLGNVRLPEQMEQYVQKFDVVITPRRGSPYGCTMISYKDQFVFNISRFCYETELIDVFTEKMNRILTKV